MSTEETAPAVEPVTEAPAVDTDGTAAEQRVPLDRFRAVTGENKELREQVGALEKWKEEQEQAQLTELERERSAREKAEAAALEAGERAQNLERGTWVRNAATAAGFTDPDDAVALLGTGGIDDLAIAQSKVAELAEKKPHLLAGPGQPAPIGAPLNTATQPAVNTDDPRAGLGSDILGYLRSK